MSALTVVKSLAGCASLVMILSPSVAVYRVHKNQQVGLVSFIPLVSLLANSHIWMMYGYLTGLIFPVFITFVIGDVVALGYIAVYWRYTTERAYVRRVFLGVISFLLAMSLYAILGGLGYLGQSEHGVGNVMGYVADIVAVCLYGAPMEKIFLVLKHKSAAYFQIHMVIAGTTNNALWFTYGILAHNWFIISPNILFLTLGSTTLVLYMVYNPKTHPLMLPEDKAEVEQSVSVIIEMTPTCAGGKSHSFEAMHSPLAPLRS
jgi:solute carrier family 50 protein (sugar transporter)